MKKHIAVIGCSLALAACGGPTGPSAPVSSSASPTPSTAVTSSSKPGSAYEANQVMDAAWKSLSGSARQDACVSNSDIQGVLGAALKKEWGDSMETDAWTQNFVETSCAAEQQAAAAAATEKKAEAERKALRSPKSYSTVSKRSLAKVVRDPESFVGKKYVLYGEVTQFDSATGTDAFLADVAATDIREYGYWIGGDNAMVAAGAADLSDVVEDDIVKLYVTVTGSLTYDTQIGGSTTVPQFEVNIVKVIGQSKS